MAKDKVSELVNGFAQTGLLVNGSSIGTMYRVSRLAEIFERQQRRSLGHSQHTLEEFEVLMLLLLRSEHTFTPKQLSDAIFVSPANMTAKLSRLEASGAIRRVLNPTDRRSIVVELTDQGQEMVRESLCTLADVADEALKPLTNEQAEQFSCLLAKLLISHGDTADTGDTGE